MRHVQAAAAAAAAAAIIKSAAPALPLVCTAAIRYIHFLASSPCLSPARGEKFSKARPQNKAALYVLGVLTSTQMTHFSISKGLKMGGKRRGWGGSSGANHVNLKQATNPGGFLFLCGALLSSVFPFLCPVI